MEIQTLESLRTQRERLLKKRKSLLDSFSKAVSSGKRKQLVHLFVKIQQTNEFLKSLAIIEADAKTLTNISGRRRYAVSSLFLHESFRKLTADQDEQFFFVTGSEI